METEISYLEERHASGADVVAQLGVLCPAMGMIGTVIGLVQMLQTMSDPSTIGPAMAVALLTTLYGAILANLVFNPMAGKLKARSKEEVLAPGNDHGRHSRHFQGRKPAHHRGKTQQLPPAQGQAGFGLARDGATNRGFPTA